MNKPNVIMFHRVRISKNQELNKFYFQRKMIHSIEYIYKIIDTYLNNGFKFGSIEQCIESQQYFHLSFDDGFKEHLTVATLLKQKYNIDNSLISFSINVANSISNVFTGMDLIYCILNNQELKKLNLFFKTNFDEIHISEIKKHIANLKPEQLKDFSDNFREFHKNLKNIFLNPSEIIELSKLFQINSHGITHRFLTSHKEESKKEILLSKEVLESIIKKGIDTFCYPEGKNDIEIQSHCKNAGYKYALSIKHEQNNKFCVGRKI